MCVVVHKYNFVGFVRCQVRSLAWSRPINPAIDKTRSDGALVAGKVKIPCASADSLGNVCICSFRHARDRNVSRGIMYFYRASSYASVVLAVVIVCPSVPLSDTRMHCNKNQTMHCRYFDITQNSNHLSFVTATVVNGRRPFRLKFVLKVTHSPSKNADFDIFSLVTSQP